MAWRKAGQERSCFGEKRCCLSWTLFQIAAKFRVPTEGSIYQGSEQVHGPAGSWDVASAGEMHESRDWDAYSEQAYASHQEYINDLYYLTVQFKYVMQRRNKKGRTVAAILESGASYSHSHTYAMVRSSILR